MQKYLCRNYDFKNCIIATSENLAIMYKDFSGRIENLIVLFEMNESNYEALVNDTLGDLSEIVDVLEWCEGFNEKNVTLFDSTDSTIIDGLYNVDAINLYNTVHGKRDVLDIITA